MLVDPLHLYLLTVLYIASARVFLRSFDSLDEKFIHRDTEKIKQTFNDELNTLSRTSKALSNLLSSAPKNTPLNAYLKSFDLDLIATFDRSSRFLSGKMNGPNQGAENQLPEEVVEGLSHELSSLVHLVIGKPVSGVTLLANGPMLISVYPVPGAQMNSSKPGFVVIGRSINNSITRKFVQSSGLKLSSQFLEGNSISEEYRTALIALDENRSIAIQKVDDNKIAGYFLLEDINGNPSLFLQIQSPRTCTFGLASAHYLIGFALVIGLILLALTLWLFEYLVISRLAYLRSNLALIAENTTLSDRLPVSGKDEFSQVATLINGVLNALEESTREKLYRLTQFRTAAEISRTIITEFDTEKILQQAVDAIHARFQLPYVGVYLQGNNSRFASLQAVSTCADIKPTIKGEEIDIQGNSTVGQCIRNQAPFSSEPDRNTFSQTSHLRN
jgi:sensor domain CHASE-containing protein